MLRSVAVLVAAGLIVASAARAAECPSLFTYGLLPFETSFDPNQQPTKTPYQATFVPAVAVHEVVAATPNPILTQDLGWCNDIGNDAISVDNALDSPIASGHALFGLGDGLFTLYASGAVPESLSQDPRSGQSLVQVGFRDVIQVGGSGTDPVTLTLHRTINGDWTSYEGHGNTLYVLGTRSFELVIHELASPNVPGSNSYTQRLFIDDDEGVGFLNQEQDYPFSATPGHTLVLTLYLEAGVQCAPDLSYGDPPVMYKGCFGFVDFGGDQFGAAIDVSISGPAANPLSADSGLQYVPEPGAATGALFADASLLALCALRRRASS